MSKQAAEPKKGEWAPAPAGALRTPCPVLNALANHGHIPRDGRDMTADQLKAAFRYIGFDYFTTQYLVNGAFKVHADNPVPGSGTDRLGLRNEGQVNAGGVPVLNLDQVGRPHAVEHDVSMSRQDREIGDCVKLQPDLVNGLIQCPVDGKNLTISDMGTYRKKRYDEQKAANPQLDFDQQKHMLACGEAAAFQGIFGRGWTYAIPIEYVRAMFVEERLPYKEGWSPRWTGYGFIELFIVLKMISSWAWPF